jgi:hypothetical protein
VKNKKNSVAQFLLNNQIEDQFHLPLSVQVFQEYQAMQELIQQVRISVDNNNSWQYIWRNTNYTSSKFYHFPYRNVQPPRPFTWIWDSKCSNKIKVFTWLLLMDRLNVRNILSVRVCFVCKGASSVARGAAQPPVVGHSRLLRQHQHRLPLC